MATVKDIYKFLRDTPFQKFDNKRNDNVSTNRNYSLS